MGNKGRAGETKGTMMYKQVSSGDINDILSKEDLITAPDLKIFSKKG